MIVDIFPATKIQMIDQIRSVDRPTIIVNVTAFQTKLRLLFEE